MRSKNFGLALSFSFVLLSLVVRPASSQTSRGDQKIEQKVFSDVRRNQNATFFVVLSEQADLREAARIREWKGRGEAVTKALKDTAGRTQVRIINLLRNSNAQVTPFWL